VECPWANRFELPEDEKQLYSQLFSPPSPVVDLSVMSPEFGKERLRAALEMVHVPTAQEMGAIRMIAGSARSYCLERFGTPRDYIRAVYEEVPPLPRQQATCVTGLAGIGKSRLFGSLFKLFGQPEGVEVPDHRGFIAGGMWSAQMNLGPGIGRVLASHLGKGTSKSKGIIATAQRESLLQGIAILGTDEFQFISHSTNVLAAKTLLQFQAVGPHLVYAANYAMLSRLLERPQEERDRLLGNIVVMQPDLPQSPEWCSFLTAIFSAAPELNELQANVAAERMWDYTFGIRRKVVALLVQAYSVMRRRKAAKLTAADLDGAFASAEYMTHREDVEQLQAVASGGSSRRADLICPVDLDDGGRSADISRRAASEMEAQKRIAELAANKGAARNKRRIAHQCC
jgi:hypothetical protein